jgi:hypothetical protein
MPSGGERSLRGSVRSSLRSSRFCRPWGSKLCLANVDPPQVRNHVSEGMQIVAFHHTKMARELAALRAAVSSTVEFVLGHSLDETLRMKVVDELVAEF